MSFSPLSYCLMFLSIIYIVTHVFEAHLVMLAVLGIEVLQVLYFRNLNAILLSLIFHS